MVTDTGLPYFHKMQVSLMKTTIQKLEAKIVYSRDF